MAIAYRSISSTLTSNGHSMIFGLPSGYQENDIFILALSVTGDVSAITLPSGFIQFHAMNHHRGFVLMLAYHRATGIEPDFYQVDMVNASSGTGAMVAFSGCLESGYPIDVMTSNLSDNYVARSGGYNLVSEAGTFQMIGALQFDYENMPRQAGISSFSDDQGCFWTEVLPMIGGGSKENWIPALSIDTAPASSSGSVGDISWVQPEDIPNIGFLFTLKSQPAGSNDLPANIRIIVSF